MLVTAPAALHRAFRINRDGASDNESLCPPLSIAEHLPIRLLAEADKQRIANAQRRRFQIAAGSEKVRSQRIIIGRIAGHVEDGDFLAACRDHTLCGASQLQPFLAAAAVLRCIYDCAGRFDIVGGKKLLRFLAAASAAAMVHPFDAGRHALSFRLGGRFRHGKQLAGARSGAAAQRGRAWTRRLDGNLRFRLRLLRHGFRFLRLCRLQR